MSRGNRLRPLVAAAVALLMGAAGCGSGGGTVRHSPSAQPTASEGAPVLTAGSQVIMPLGDSITDGLVVPGGYRTDLANMLAATGRTVRFVGSRSGGPPQLTQPAHEGHPGWTIGQLETHVKAWLNRYRPTVIMLQIGTNDLVKNFQPAAAPQRLTRLINDITATLPYAQLYVATITPIANPRLEALVQRFNAAITKIVTARQAASSLVKLVDMHSALTRADLSPDGTHPNTSGYSKMAVRWFETLTSAPVMRWSATDRTIGTVNDGERLPSTNASSGTKVGFLDNADSWLQLKLTVPSAGWYYLFVRAANGANTVCSQLLDINGRPRGELDYPSYGWEQWNIIGTEVELTAGQNLVRLSHRNCGVELDSVAVTAGRAVA